ncbi:MAG: substrate-binding domain-containing protein [Myxococcota bacterium]|nr:substrate-binding domain-containing protein [Myxococcota bacterium]
MVCVGAWNVHADAPYITLASTTSTENSGLLDDLLPRFTAQSGIEVRVVAVGTGQALRLARAGDADVLLVHDRVSEEKFVAEGYGVERVLVMANDFVIVGPKSDPAELVGSGSIQASLAKIFAAELPFVSRGDDSGTHKAELRLWKEAGLDPGASSGTWYREVGRGMGAALNTASAMGAYTLSDRGTWLSFQNRGDLGIVFEGDPGLENPYGVIVVNPERHAHAKAQAAQRLVDWFVSDAGQGAIDAFQLGGEQLFFSRAKAASAVLRP